MKRRRSFSAAATRARPDAITGVRRWLPVLFLVGFSVFANEEEATPFTRLFDTGARSDQRLSEEAVAKRSGWQAIAEDTTNYTFAGDAVLLNDKLVVVLRKEARAAEVYSKAATGMKYRAGIGRLATTEPLESALDRFKIVENTSGAVMVEAGAANTPGASLRFRLTTGEAILELRPLEGGGFVRVHSSARYAVVPDYFGDDMVFGGAPTKALCVPAENFCLNLIDGGEAIVMTVWQSSEQEVWLDPPDEASGTASMSRVGCLKGRSIWLAFLESPEMWQAGAGGAGESQWKPPFPAKWRWSYVRANGLADSWDQEKGPGPGQNSGQHEGPLLMYPLDRSSATPLTALCPTDVMRNTLGVGPCQYILACEGLGAQGDPTPNSVMNWVEKQFELKKEKKVADDIKERLRVMTRHVADARQRIKRYGEFSMKVRSQVGSGAGELGSILEDLDRFVAAGLAPAASPERAGQLADKVAALIGQPDAMAACRSLGEQLREIGAVQDGALARSRMAVRRLKAQCRSTAVPQEAGGSIKAIEQIAETMLRNK